MVLHNDHYYLSAKPHQELKDPVDNVTAIDNTITINSDVAIWEFPSDLDTDLRAATLLLTANDGIQQWPTRGAIETDVASLEAHSTTSGNIAIDEIDDITVQKLEAPSGAVDVRANGNITVAVGSDVKSRDSMILHSGIDGAGDLTFDPGATLDGLTIVLWAGDGFAGRGTAAKIDSSNIGVAAGNTSFTTQQDAPITDTPAHAQFYEHDVTRIDLQLRSDDGSISSTTAHNWKSITATAHSGITLEGSGNISTKEAKTTTGNISIYSTYSTSGDLTVDGEVSAGGGGVGLIADAGKIYTRRAGARADTLDVAITGFSDNTGGDTTGVDLPYGGGKAAIVIKSRDNLTLGANCNLVANGVYDATRVDDRPGVRFKSTGEGSGSPIDAAIYVGSSGSGFPGFRGDSQGGNVTVECPVSIGSGGTMVIDAQNKVDPFGERFTTSWKKSWEVNGGTNRLEVVSRRTQTLDQAAEYGTLPHAKEARQGKYLLWFKKLLPSYVLRGKKVAEVLTNVGSAPADSGREEQRQRRERFEEEVPVPEPPLDLRDRHGNRVREIEQGMPLQNGYTIETPEYIRAFIDFPDGSRVIMEPNTDVTIESRSIFLSSGSIWFWRISETGADRFEVRTTYVTASVTGSWWALPPCFLRKQIRGRGEHSIESFLKRVKLESNRNLWDPVAVDPGQLALFYGNDAPQVRDVALSERTQRLEAALRRLQAHMRKSRMLTFMVAITYLRPDNCRAQTSVLGRSLLLSHSMLRGFCGEKCR